LRTPNEGLQTTWRSSTYRPAAGLFYDRLFQLDPALRHLFTSADMREQGRKLTQMITVAVRGLDRWLIPAIRRWVAATRATACRTPTTTRSVHFRTLEQGSSSLHG
jgi:hypothetical protein